MKAIKDLFKPYELDFANPSELLEVVGLSEDELLEMLLQDECSKSLDKSCANNDCPHNFVKYHESVGGG